MSLNQIWDIIDGEPRIARLAVKSLKVDGVPITGSNDSNINITTDEANFPYSEDVSTKLYFSNNNNEKYSFNETDYPPKKSTYCPALYDYNGTTYTVSDETTFINALNNCANGDIIYFNSAVTFTNSTVYHINKSILITGANVEIINNTSTNGIFDVTVPGVTFFNLKLKSNNLTQTKGLVELNTSANHVVFQNIEFTTNAISVLCLSGSNFCFDTCHFLESNSITHIKFDTGVIIKKLIVRNCIFTGNGISTAGNSSGLFVTNNAIVNGDVYLDNNNVGQTTLGKNLRNFCTFTSASRQHMNLYVNNNSGYISDSFILIESLGIFLSDIGNLQITNNNIQNNDSNFLGLIVVSSTTPNTLFPSDTQYSTDFRFRGYGNSTPSTINGAVVQPLRPYTISNSLLTITKSDFVDVPTSVSFFLRPAVL